MKVGDLVKMPGCFVAEEAEAIGVVTRIESQGPLLPRRNRIEIYWIQDKEYSWEPTKWLEVISEK